MSGDFKIGRLNGRFVVSWWLDGARKRYRLEARTREEAETEAITVIRRENKPSKTSTIETLWEAYRLEKHDRRVATIMKHEWKALGPVIGHLKPEEITIDICRHYIALRRKTTAKGKSTKINDGAIWTELGHLRTVLKWALGDKAPKIERPQKPAPKDRYLTHAEISKLLDAPSAAHIQLAIHLMLATASRVGAILELTWDRVDLERGQIDLRAKANGPRKGRAVVPINAGLRAALSSAYGARLTDYVIEWAGQPVANIKTGFNNAVKAAGLKNVSPHVLRHTAAVHMVEAGIPIIEVAQFLGHSNPSVTFHVYGRFSPSHLRKAADVLDFTKIRAV